MFALSPRTSTHEFDALPVFREQRRNPRKTNLCLSPPTTVKCYLEVRRHFRTNVIASVSSGVGTENNHGGSDLDCRVDSLIS